MCRAGGPRCKGQRTATSTFTAGSGGDGKSRRFDGQPETDADRRFFDLRESGYSGPIDQDGRIPGADDPAHGILDALRTAS